MMDPSAKTLTSLSIGEKKQNQTSVQVKTLLGKLSALKGTASPTIS